MKSIDKVKILIEIINALERYEIAIDIYENFDALMKPVKSDFFNAVWQRLKEQLDWLKDETWGYKISDDCLEGSYYIFKLSWLYDKDKRGIYSFGIEQGNGWGLVRNNNNYAVKDLIAEEKPIFDATSKCPELTPAPNDGWWLTYKKTGNNLPKWNCDTLRMICDPKSPRYSALIEEYFWRMETMLSSINDGTKLESVIDDCIRERKKIGKL